LIAQISIIVSYAIQVLLPLNLLKLVDEVIKEGRHELIGSVLNTYLLLFVISVVNYFIFSQVWQTIYNNYTVDIKCAVFKKVIYAQAKELNSINSGDIMSRIDVDCDQFNEAIFKNVFHFINSFLLCAGIIFILARINITISLMVFAAAFLPVLASQFFNKYVEKYTFLHRSISGDFTGKLFEFFNGFRDLRLQNGISYVENIIKTTLLKFIELGNAIKRVNLAVEKIIYLLNLSVSLAIYIFCAYQVANGLLTIGGFIVSITYIALMHRKLNWMLRIWLSWHAKKVSVDRVNEVLSFKQEENCGKDIKAINRLDIEDVGFGYNRDFVLKNISFSIQKGEKIAVVGVSGVGKTTLIGLLLRLYKPENGKIYINGEDINGFGLYSVREKYCVVSQEIMLFDTTIRHNLTLGKKIPEPDIWKMLDIVGLKDTIEKLPGKLDFVFSKGNDLSGGQKQRLMIARAVLKNADVYILDEATSALDICNEKILTDQLIYNDIIKTAIVISHRYAAIKNCDKVLVLNDGAVECFLPMDRAREQSLTFNRLFPGVAK